MNIIPANTTNCLYYKDDGRKELILEAGDTIKLTTDDAFKEKCTKEVLWLDYKNISKVCKC